MAKLKLYFNGYRPSQNNDKFIVVYLSAAPGETTAESIIDGNRFLGFKSQKDASNGLLDSSQWDESTIQAYIKDEVLFECQVLAEPNALSKRYSVLPLDKV